jgi:hypothetical protein
MVNGALVSLSTARWFVWTACRGSAWKPLPIAIYAANNLRSVVGHSYSCVPKQSNDSMMSNNIESSQVLNHKTVQIVWHDTATEFGYYLPIKWPQTYTSHMKNVKSLFQIMEWSPLEPSVVWIRNQYPKIRGLLLHTFLHPPYWYCWL